MKEVIIEIKAYQCEACNLKHDEEYKDAIFRCPEHGEFCNDGGMNTCGLFRFIESKETEIISCPICGWSPIRELAENQNMRRGEKPKTEKEIESFKKAQNYLMNDPHNHSGYSSFKRIQKETAHEQGD